MPAEQQFSTPVEATDAELMSRLVEGDDLALNAIMLRWKSRVAAFLYRMTSQQEAAADLTQETFVKLYQARSRYIPSGNFSTYLFAIASNLARNYTRWRVRHPTVSIDDDQAAGLPALLNAQDLGQSPDEAVVSADALRAINDAFQSLPIDLREAMTLFIYEGMSYAEISDVTGCTIKAAETRIYRARQILKEKLKDIRT